MCPTLSAHWSENGNIQLYKTKGPSSSVGRDFDTQLAFVQCEIMGTPHIRSFTLDKLFITPFKLLIFNQLKDIYKCNHKGKSRIRIMNYK